MHKLIVVGKKENAGGAAVATRRLVSGLRLAGQDVSLLVQTAQSTDPGTITLACRKQHLGCWQLQERMANDLVRSRRANPGGSAFSFPYPGMDLASLAGTRNALLVNIHHVPGFLSTESISGLLRQHIPVVITLHDQWMLTGGCHYSDGCDRYREDCRDCPQLTGEFRDIPARVLQNRLKLWQDNLILVAPSRWMRDCAKSSRLFRHSTVEWIPNGLDTRMFSPQQKMTAKREAGISPRSRVILFGAPSFRVRRKGFAEIQQALLYCLKDPGFARAVRSGAIRLVAFGTPGTAKAAAGDLPIHWLGKMKTETALVALYRSADVFVLPSLEDNLPNTMLEAMACGTPLAAFATGGIPDAVRDGETGFLAACGNSQELGARILDLIKNPRRAKRMGRAAADLVQKEFRLDLQAERYLRLFGQVAADRLSGGIDEKSAAVNATSTVITADPAPIAAEFFFSMETRFQQQGVTADCGRLEECGDRR